MLSSFTCRAINVASYSSPIYPYAHKGRHIHTRMQNRTQNIESFFTFEKYYAVIWGPENVKDEILNNEFIYRCRYYDKLFEPIQADQGSFPYVRTWCVTCSAIDTTSHDGCVVSIFNMFAGSFSLPSRVPRFFMLCYWLLFVVVAVFVGHMQHFICGKARRFLLHLRIS